jgi:hypothetical protein
MRRPAAPSVTDEVAKIVIADHRVPSVGDALF